MTDEPDPETWAEGLSPDQLQPGQQPYVDPEPARRWCTDCGEQGVAWPWRVCDLCGSEQTEPFREGWDESD